MCIIYYVKGSPEWKQNPSGAVTRPSSNTRSDNSARFRHAKSPQQGTYSILSIYLKIHGLNPGVTLLDSI